MGADPVKSPRAWLQENQIELLAILGRIPELANDSAVPDRQLANLTHILRAAREVVWEIRAAQPRRPLQKWPVRAAYPKVSNGTQ
jgi:hypothetical protein